MVFQWFSNGFPMIFQFPPKKTRFFQGQGTNSPEQTALRGRNSPSDTSRVPVPEKIYVARSRTEKHTEFSILHTYIYIYIYICVCVCICTCMYMYMCVCTGIIRCPMHPPYAGGASRARPLAPQLCSEKITHVGQKTTKSNNPLKGLS